MHYLVLLATIVLSLCLGCTTPAEHESAMHLTYHRFTGTSPGGGFSNTTLQALELDFSCERFRALDRSARHPEPMLPYEPAAIQALLQAQPWQPLHPRRAEQLRHRINAWVQTDPPASYDQPRGLGHEDGYAERLDLLMSDQQHTLDINPRGPLAGPLSPTPQWTRLIHDLKIMTAPQLTLQDFLPYLNEQHNINDISLVFLRNSEHVFFNAGGALVWATYILADGTRLRVGEHGTGSATHLQPDGTVIQTFPFGTWSSTRQENDAGQE